MINVLSYPLCRALDPDISVCALFPLLPINGPCTNLCKKEGRQKFEVRKTQQKENRFWMLSVVVNGGRDISHRDTGNITNRVCRGGEGWIIGRWKFYVSMLWGVNYLSLVWKKG